MSSVETFYTAFRFGTKTVAPTITDFKGINICIQYISTITQKPISTLQIHTKDQISSDLHRVVFRLKTTQPKIVWNYIKMKIMSGRFLTEEDRCQGLFILLLLIMSAGKYR